MQLEIQDLNISLGGKTILADLSLPATETKTLALIGPSGGGKSTLLRVLGGLLPPDQGTVRVNGSRLPTSESELRSYRRRMGMVFQNWNLFFHLTALENIVLPLVEVHGVPRKEATDRAITYLERFGLREHARKKPGELSGGQQQRVALVRARAIEPEVLLLDEPTSALDPEMAAQVLELVEEVAREGLPVILVTHHLAFARRASDTLAFLKAGQIEASGPTETFFSESQGKEIDGFLAKVMSL
jgi:polar amino acid transport system ATP-binding protein